jgi:hypothetical protein
MKAIGVDEEQEPVATNNVQGLYPEVGHLLRCAPSKRNEDQMSRNLNTCICIWLASIRRLRIARSS